MSRRLNRADVQVALLDSVVLAVACLASYWLTVHLVPHVRPVSKPDDLIGALWAVIATVFVFRDSYQRSLTAAASRIAATSVSFALCLIYLAFLPFHLWALALLIGVTVLAVTLLGRPDDVVTAAITTAVIMIASEVSPHHAWQQPILRLADTVIGVAIGLAAAWLTLRLTQLCTPVDEWAWRKSSSVREVLARRGEPVMQPSQPHVEASWTVRATVAIDASDEKEARAILGHFLDKMEVRLLGEPTVMRSNERFWTLRFEIDLSVLESIDPDTTKPESTV